MVVKTLPIPSTKLPENSVTQLKKRSHLSRSGILYLVIKFFKNK